MIPTLSNFSIPLFTLGILVLATGFAAGLMLTNDPTLVMLTVVISFCLFFLWNRRRIWIWLLLVIVFGINVFGIFSGMALPHIPLPGLGTVHISDILLGFATLHAVYHRYEKKGRCFDSYLRRPLFLLLVLVLVEAVRNLAQGLDLHSLMNGLRSVAYYLMFFIIITEVDTEEQLHKLFAGLMIVALISSLVTNMQFFFGVSLSGSKVEMFQDTLVRTYPVSGALVNLVLLSMVALSFSAHLSVRGRIAGWTGIVFLLGAIVTTFARSTWAAVLIALVLVVVLSRGIRWKNAAFVVIFAFLGALAFNMILQKAGGGRLELLITRSQSGIMDFRQRTGSLESRINLLGIRWVVISRESPWLGRGFDWGTHREDARVGGNMAVNLNPYAPSADNGIATLFVLFGYSGIVLFILIYTAVFREAARLLRNISYQPERSVIIGILAFNIQQILVSFFSNIISSAHAVVILATSWGLLVLMGRFHKERAEKISMERKTSTR